MSLVISLGEGGHAWDTVRLADNVPVTFLFGDDEAPVATIEWAEPSS